MSLIVGENVTIEGEIHPVHAPEAAATMIPTLIVLSALCILVASDR
jgi:hypothetical protein